MAYPDIATLPVAEKLQLMESLWDALCRETRGAPETPAWHQAEIEQRIARLASGEETTSPWEEAKKRIREQAGAA